MLPLTGRQRGYGAQRGDIAQHYMDKKVQGTKVDIIKCTQFHNSPIEESMWLMVTVSMGEAKCTYEGE